MSLLSWLTGNKKQSSRAKAHQAGPMDSVLYEAGMEFGTMPERKPVTSTEAEVMSAAERTMQQRREQRKADRMGRREALFGIVRESMLRAGILSSAYKFKVLSIDQKGRHFLVLLDLSLDLARTEPATRLLEIEKMIVESAQNRVQVTVQAVYWRHYQAAPAAGSAAHGPSGTVSPLRAAAAARMAAAAESAPTGENLTAALGSSADSISAALAAAREKMPPRVVAGSGPDSGPTSTASAVANFAATQPFSASAIAPPVADQSEFANTQVFNRKGDDLGDDEIAAFQRALAAGSTAPLPVSAPAPLPDYQPSIFITGRGRIGSATAHDFDDEDDEDGQLSMTQHGELR